MEDFIKEFKDVLNLAGIARKAGIKGNKLQQISSNVPYRHLSNTEEENFIKTLEPLYQALMKKFKENPKNM